MENNWDGLASKSSADLVFICTSTMTVRVTIRSILVTIHSAPEKGRKVFQMFVCRVLKMINAQLHPSPETCQLYTACLLQGLPPPNGASIGPSGPQSPNRHHNKRWSLVNFRPVPICQDKSKRSSWRNDTSSFFGGTRTNLSS